MGVEEVSQLPVDEVSRELKDDLAEMMRLPSVKSASLGDLYSLDENFNPLEERCTGRLFMCISHKRARFGETHGAEPADEDDEHSAACDTQAYGRKALH